MPKKSRIYWFQTRWRQVELIEFPPSETKIYTILHSAHQKYLVTRQCKIWLCTFCKCELHRLYQGMVEFFAKGTEKCNFLAVCWEDEELDYLDGLGFPVIRVLNDLKQMNQHVFASATHSDKRLQFTVQSGRTKAVS